LIPEAASDPSLDAWLAFSLAGPMRASVEKQGQLKLYESIELPSSITLSTMESHGISIDTAKLEKLFDALSAEVAIIAKEAYKIIGKEINLASPKQLQTVLFDELGMTGTKALKTGFSTNAAALNELFELNGHPFLEKLLAHRDSTKLKQMVETLLKAVEDDSKIHTTYVQTGTSTGRLSSESPNLQNIPIRDAQGKEIRKAFIPEDGELFLSADYSQIELRIMAHLSNDINMIDAFNSGLDIHTATAAKIYKIALEDVNSDMRRKAKTANFGIIYGISAFGLAERLSISRSEAKELIEGYFNTYPDVKKYMDNAIQSAKETGYVETIFGRKRQLSDINSQNSIVRGYAERNAINAPIQGSAADIIKIAMIRIQNRIVAEGLKMKMNMQVHDELNFSVPENEIEAAKKLVVEEMENTVKLKVPLIADHGVGVNWLEAH
jgi:DNA polymerase-1